MFKEYMTLAGKRQAECFLFPLHSLLHFYPYPQPADSFVIDNEYPASTERSLAFVFSSDVKAESLIIPAYVFIAMILVFYKYLKT